MVGQEGCANVLAPLIHIEKDQSYKWQNVASISPGVASGSVPGPLGQSW